MKAYHFLREDMRSGCGDELPWTVGEERSLPRGTKAVLCGAGYHSSPSWFDALRYAPGPVACIVEVSRPVAKDTDKAVSRRRKLIVAKNADGLLRAFACDCAERALLRERQQGREPDERSWKVIEVARRYAEGKATEKELRAAEASAEAAWAAKAPAWAAWARLWASAEASAEAAWAAEAAEAARLSAEAAWAAWLSAKASAEAAAKASAEAAEAAEAKWQREHLTELLDAAVLINA